MSEKLELRHNGKLFESEYEYFESIAVHGDYNRAVMEDAVRYYRKQCKELIDLSFDLAKRLNYYEGPIRDMIEEVLREEKENVTVDSEEI